MSGQRRLEESQNESPAVIDLASPSASTSSHVASAGELLNESTHHAHKGGRLDPHVDVVNDVDIQVAHDRDHSSDTASSSMPSRSFSTDDMRSKMALALQEQLQAHGDLTARYEHTLTVEGSSPKPCIVPGNALQLIDDDPEGQSPGHHPPSIIIINDHPNSKPRGGMCTPDTSSAEHEAEAQPRPIPRVRFRSRVRITSGLPRHRHSTSNGNGNHTSTSASSSASSPSSSISAPLRWQPDENGAWGPLGRRLSGYAQANRWRKRSPTVTAARPPKHIIHSKRASYDERTPLISAGRPRVSYVDSGLDGGGMADDERTRLLGNRTRSRRWIDEEDEDELTEEERALKTAALRREEEAVFGTWPWRLFNRHWWWWHVEPVLCCCCSDDSDYEE